MRKINEIVVHHSVTPRDLSAIKSLGSFNRTHKLRLHDKQKTPQPISGTEYSHIAYHAVIDGKGKRYETRLDDVMGYHASNRRVNRESLGVVMLGNFDIEHPSQEQLDELENYILDKKEIYDIKKVTGHRKYANKTCPGLNISDEYINSLNFIDKHSEFWDWGIKHNITNGERARDFATREEVTIMIKRSLDMFKGYINEKILESQDEMEKIIEKKPKK